MDKQKATQQLLMTTHWERHKIQCWARNSKPPKCSPLVFSQAPCRHKSSDFSVRSVWLKTLNFSNLHQTHWTNRSQCRILIQCTNFHNYRTPTPKVYTSLGRARNSVKCYRDNAINWNSSMTRNVSKTSKSNALTTCKSIVINRKANRIKIRANSGTSKLANSRSRSRTDSKLENRLQNNLNLTRLCDSLSNA